MTVHEPFGQRDEVLELLLVAPEALGRPAQPVDEPREVVVIDAQVTGRGLCLGEFAEGLLAKTDAETFLSINDLRPPTFILLPNANKSDHRRTGNTPWF